MCPHNLLQTGACLGLQDGASSGVKFLYPVGCGTCWRCKSLSQGPPGELKFSFCMVLFWWVCEIEESFLWGKNQSALWRSGERSLLTKCVGLLHGVPPCLVGMLCLSTFKLCRVGVSQLSYELEMNFCVHQPYISLVTLQTVCVISLVGIERKWGVPRGTLMVGREEHTQKLG